MVTNGTPGALQTDEARNSLQRLSQDKISKSPTVMPVWFIIFARSPAVGTGLVGGVSRLTWKRYFPPRSDGAPQDGQPPANLAVGGSLQGNRIEIAPEAKATRKRSTASWEAQGGNYG
jgi:hypothetical protein